MKPIIFLLLLSVTASVAAAHREGTHSKDKHRTRHHRDEDIQMYETGKSAAKVLEFPLITRKYEDVPFTRNVTFMRFGKYSPVPSFNFSEQGYGSVFFTTMEPLPGVFVVEWKCAYAQNECDISELNSYDHLNSTSKGEYNN
jgi:hypothetical protein